MSDERNPDDAALDAALDELPVPVLSAELRQRLEAIPARGAMRRFPVRSLRVSALGWAAAAALGLFIGAQSIDEADSNVDTAAEDESLALAVGSFAELEEEP